MLCKQNVRTISIVKISTSTWTYRNGEHHMSLKREREADCNMKWFVILEDGICMRERKMFF